MNKSKLRRKILKLRKVNFNKDLKINPRKFFSILKKKKINIKYIGGYYPCNYEIDSLEKKKK